jgi:O-antigen/teichoic acid export membrane protein
LQASIWSLIGTIAAQVAILAGNAIAARILGAETYGAYGLTLSSAAMIATLAAAGVVMVTTRGVAHRSVSGHPGAVASHIRHCLIVTALLWLACGLALCACANWFSVNVLHTPQAAQFLWAAVLLGLPLALTQIGYAALAGLKTFRKLAKIRAFTGIFSATLLIASTYAQSLFLIIATAVFASAVSSWVGIKACLDQLRSGPSVQTGDSGARPKPHSLGHDDQLSLLPAIATGLIAVPVIWLCQTISSGAGGGLAPFAALTVITMWSQAVLLVPLNIGQPLLPAMVEALASQRNPDRPWKLLIASMGLIAAFAVPASAFLAAISKYLLAFYGPSFAQYAGSFVVLIGVAAIQALNIPALVTIQALGKLWVHFACNFIWAGVFIGLTLAFRSEGVSGYARACLIAFLVHSLLVNCWAVLRLRARIGVADLESPRQITIDRRQ